MLKRFVVTLLTFCFIIIGINFDAVYATSSSVVISKIQTGSVSSASNEIVEIYNNTSQDIDVTNWCVKYSSSSSSAIGSNVFCFQTGADGSHIFLPSYKPALLMSTNLSDSVTLALGADALFSAGLAATGGHIRLLDDGLVEVDKVGWGTAISAEGNTNSLTPDNQAVAPNNTQMLRRKILDSQVLQDTNINSQDFELVLQQPNYDYGYVYEVEDLCSNVLGFQPTVPVGYEYDGLGNCNLPPVDICANIDGLQTDLPVGYGQNELGDCLPDVCLNLESIQFVLPEDYKFVDTDCLLDLPSLVINELLANPEGDDLGNELIEIYNPNSQTVYLDHYQLAVGVDSIKYYDFPAGLYIEANSYLSINNSTITFTLTNTTSKVALISKDDQLISESNTYQDAKDDMAWALIDGVWQYTNRPTFGSVNLPSLEEPLEPEVLGSTLKPCAPNQYRNPETNRCKLITPAGSSLVPCKIGQYRSEETNRCRNIAEDASLVPCGPGQERNPETNRCRNVLGVMTTAPFAIEPISVNQGGSVDLWVLGGVSLIALAYALWEWREEFKSILNKVVRVLPKTKID